MTDDPNAFGRYEVLRTVGRGGMAVVYEARDPALGRTVALKVLSDGADPRLVERLHREANAVARLRHPNIVAVHEVGERFIAMDFVAGSTLADARRHMTTRRRIEALATVARAVAFAHDNGVVHRDLKPQNVLVEAATGAVFLTDFGLARVVNADALTRSGATVGTPFYMAPEQVRGDREAIRPATDVWALGVMLYELLTERLPFAGVAPAEIYRAILEEDPPRPGRSGLETVALRALEKEPLRRYPTAAAFADELDRWLRGAAVLARPTPVLSRSWRRVRRNPLAAALAGVLVLVVGVGCALVLVQRARERAETRRHAREAERLLASPDIASLIAADRHAEMAGDADLRRRVNRLLGQRALDKGDFNLARLALAACGDDPEPLVAARRDAELRRRRSRLEAVLDDLRSGSTRRHAGSGVPWMDDFVFECARYGDEQTVALLGEALAPLSGSTQEERDLMIFAFRVLGRLDMDSAVAPLADAMRRLTDHALAVECGLALCNTRRPGARAPLLAARDRLGVNSSSWRAIARLLGRVPDPAETPEPRSAADFVARGLLRREKEDLDGAVKDFTRALELEPGLAAAYVNRAVARIESGDPDGAERDCARALELDPSLADAHLNRGTARRRKGDLDGAIADYTRAIALQPQNAGAYSGRGLAREGRGDLDGAIQDFSLASEADPSFAQALVHRAHARLTQGDAAAAIEDCTRALALDPLNVSAHLGRGNARIQKGDFDGAIADITRAIELAPLDAHAHFNRGFVRHAAGDHEGAIADFSRAIELDPRDAMLYASRAGARNSRSDYAGAIADGTRALELDARCVTAYVNRGNACRLTADLDGAIRDTTRAIEIDPRCAAAFYNRGLARLQKREYDGAVADWERVLALQPDPSRAAEVRDMIRQVRDAARK